MWDCNYLYPKIAVTVNIAVLTAYNTMKYHKEHNTIQFLPWSDCLKALSDQDIQRIIQEILQNCFVPYSKVTKLLHPITTLQVPRTVYGAGYGHQLAAIWKLFLVDDVELSARHAVVQDLPYGWGTSESTRGFADFWVPFLAITGQERREGAGGDVTPTPNALGYQLTCSK